MTKSCLSHKLSGERQITNSEFESIIKAFSPSIAEEQKLRFLFQNYEFGEERYEEVIEIKKYIEEFADDDIIQINSTGVDLNYVSVINDESMLNEIMYEVLLHSWAKDQIDIMCQPDYKHLTDILLNLSNREHALVRQIVRFNNDYKGDRNAYNIGCLGTLNRIVIHNEKHSIRYFYSNLDTIINITSIFPFFVATKKHLLLLSNDYKRGYLVHEPSAVAEYHRQFDELYSRGQELYQRIENDIEYMQLCYKIEQEAVHEFYTLQYHPCFRFNGDIKMTTHSLKKEFPFKEDVIQFLLASWENGKRLKGFHMYSPHGETDFLQNGITTDMSDLIFNAIPKGDRQLLINKLKENKTQLAIKLKDDFIKIPYRLSIVCYDSGIVLFSIRGQYGTRLVLKEHSLYKSMMKFFEYAIKYEQE